MPLIPIRQKRSHVGPMRQEGHHSFLQEHQIADVCASQFENEIRGSLHQIP